jgi:putative flippase GtrA
MSSLGLQSWRFVLVGMVNTFVGLSAIWIAMIAGLSPVAANALGYAMGLCVSFRLNRRWTFRSPADLSLRSEDTASKVIRFALAFLVAWTANATIVYLGERFTTLSPYLVQIVGIGVYTIIFFLLCRGFVFKETAQ